MMPESARNTADVLEAVAKQLGALDEGALHKEMTDLQFELQEANRLLQERNLLAQLRQMSAQRDQERRNGTFRAPKWKGDKSVQRATVAALRPITDLEEAQLQQDIVTLQSELQGMNLRMQERQYAIQLRQMLTQRASGPVPGVAIPFPPGVGIPMSQAPQPPQTKRRSAQDVQAKRAAILDAMRALPAQPSTPSQVKAALIERGFPDPDAGTPVRSLMWRMAQDRIIDRVQSGSYALPTPESVGGPDANSSE